MLRKTYIVVMLFVFGISGCSSTETNPVRSQTSGFQPVPTNLALDYPVSTDYSTPTRFPTSTLVPPKLPLNTPITSLLTNGDTQTISDCAENTGTGRNLIDESLEGAIYYQKEDGYGLYGLNLKTRQNITLPIDQNSRYWVLGSPMNSDRVAFIQSPDSDNLNHESYASVWLIQREKELTNHQLDLGSLKEYLLSRSFSSNYRFDFISRASYWINDSLL